MVGVCDKPEPSSVHGGQANANSHGEGRYVLLAYSQATLRYDNLKDGYIHFDSVGDSAVETRQLAGIPDGLHQHRSATASTHVHLAVYTQVSVWERDSLKRVEAVLS